MDRIRRSPACHYVLRLALALLLCGLLVLAGEIFGSGGTLHAQVDLAPPPPTVLAAPQPAVAGGPDGGGYTFRDSREAGGPLYAWEETGVTGTELTNGGDLDDGFLGPVDLAFDFPFYGNVYDQLYVGSNGYLSFGQGYSQIPDATLPSTNAPNNSIHLFGDDGYIVDGVTHIYYQTLSNPTRLVVQFVDLDRASSRGTYATFQAILYATGNIVTQYAAVNPAYRPRSVGLENSDGSQGLSYPPAYLANDLAILFYTRGQTPPDLVQSNKIANVSTLLAGETLTYTILLSNTGGLDAHNTTVVDVLPDGTDYVNGSASSGVLYNPGQHRLTWQGTVPGDGTQWLSYQLQVRQPFTYYRSITNTVTISQSELIASVVHSKTVCVGCGLADSAWPMERGNRQRNGRSFYAGPLGDLETAWSVDIGIVSTPTIGPDGTIYAGSDDGYLYAFTPAGKQIWRIRLDTQNVVSAQAIAADSTVYAVAGSGLYAVKADGSGILWSISSGGTPTSAPVVVTDGIYIQGGAYLTAVNFDGSRRWQIRPGQSSEAITPPAVGHDGTLYVGTSSGLRAIGTDGIERWVANVGYTFYSSPAVGDDGTIYIGGVVRSSSRYEGYLSSVSPNGDILWKSKLYGGTAQAAVLSPAITSDGMVFINAAGVIHALRKDGTAVLYGKNPRFNGAPTSPVIDRNGQLLIGGQYKISAVNTGTGAEIWSHPIAGYAATDAALDSEGRLFFGNNGGLLYAVTSFPKMQASTKRVEPVTAEAGDLLTYTVVLQNDGGVAVNHAQFSDPLAAVISYMTGSAMTGARYDSAQRQIEWSGTIPAYGSIQFSYQASISPTLTPGSWISNTAILTGTSLTNTLTLPSKLCFQCGPADEWSLAQGNPSRNGRSDSSGPQVLPELAWQSTFAPSSGVVIGTDGTAYVAAADKYLYALDRNGQTKWRYNLGGVVAVTPAVSEDGTVYVAGGGLRAIKSGSLKWYANVRSDSSPLIGPDGTIYVAGSKELSAVEPDGIIRWQRQLADSTRLSSPALGSDGTIYLGTEQYLYAINSDGTERWTYETGNSSNSTPTLGPDGRIYVGGIKARYRDIYDGFLYAINSDGSLLWQYILFDNQRIGDVREIRISQIVGPDDTIYACAVSLDFTLHAIESDGSIKKWLSSGRSPVVDSQGTLYIVSRYDSTRGYLSALNNDDGSIMWQSAKSHNITSLTSLAIDHEGRAYLSADRLYVSQKRPVNLLSSSTGIHASRLAAGQILTYTITVYNSGELTANNVSVLDSIPPQTTYIADSVTGGARYDSNQNAITWSGNVPGITAHSIQFQVQVGASLPPGTEISNSVAISNTDLSSNSIVTNTGCIGCGLADSPYPMANQNPQRTGQSPLAGPTTPHLSWVYTATGAIYQPTTVAADGTLYVGSRDGFLLAIRPDGTEQWRYNLNGEVVAAPSVAADGTVYAVVRGIGGESFLYAVRSDGAGYRWRISVAHYPSTPVISLDGTIYLSDGFVTRAILPSGLEKSRVERGDTALAINPDATITFGDYEGLHVYSPNLSQMRFLNSDISSNVSYPNAPVVGADGAIYVANVKERSIDAVASSGKIRWRFELAEWVSSGTPVTPILDRYGTLYIVVNSTIYAVRTVDGAKVWRIDLQKPLASPILDAHGQLFVASQSGTLYSIRTQGRLAGTVEWQVPLGGYVARNNNPVITSQGTLVIGTVDGRLVAISDSGAPISTLDGPSWQEASVPVSSDYPAALDAVGDEVWAVGRGGLLHFKENQWKRIFNPTSNDLLGIDMFTTEEGWAVGGAGTILYYTNGTWQTFTTPTSATLRDVSIVSAENGWIVGDNGTILRYLNHSWTVEASPTTEHLTSIDMISAEEGWAVGANVLLHYSNHSWSLVDPPLQSGSWSLLAVDMVTANEGWAVGYNAILHYINGVWSHVPYDYNYAIYYDISMLSPDTGWIAGGYSGNNVILNYQNGTWREIFAESFNGWLSRVLLVDKTSGWAIKKYSNGGISSILQYTFVPFAPLLNPARNNHGGSYTVSWSTNLETNRFILEEADNPQFASPSTIYRGTDTSVDITDKPLGSRWYYRIQIEGAQSIADWSEPITVTVPPAAPTLNPADNPQAMPEYALSWSQPVGTSSFVLSSADNPNFDNSSTLYEGTNNSYDINSQLPGVWYYRVQAINDGGASPWSAPVSTLVALPDLVLHKSVLPVGGVAANGGLRYTLSYTNTGRGGAPGVILQDFIPQHTSYRESGISSDEIYANGQITWTIPFLSPGESGQVSFLVQTDAALALGTIITNQAYIHSERSPSASSNVTTNTITLQPSFALSRFGVQTGRPMNQGLSGGDFLTYTVAYTNSGALAAAGVVVEIPLPPQVGFVSACCGGNYDSSQHTISWSAGIINPGGGGNITATVRIADGLTAGQPIISRARIRSTQTNPEWTNSIETVVTDAVLHLIKEADPAGAIQPNMEITYRLIYSNTGNLTATHGLIVDPLPDEVTYQSSSSGPYNTGSRTVSFALDPVPPNSGGVVAWTGQVTSTLVQGQTIRNQASIQSDQTDRQTSNQVSNSYTFLDLDLHLATQPSSQIRPGDRLTYTLTYTNPGQVTSPHTVISLTVPSQLLHRSGGQFDGSQHRVRFDLGDVPAQSAGQVQTVLQVQDALADGIRLVAGAAISGQSAHLRQSQSVTHSVLAPTLLLNLISQPVDRIEPGRVIRYQMTYANQGQIPAENAQLIVDLPAQSDHVSGGQYNPSRHQASFDLGILAVGATGSQQLELRAKDALNNGVILRGQATLQAERAMDALATATHTVVSAPDFSTSHLAVRPDGLVAMGTVLTYTVTYSNSGNMDATGVVVLAPLPKSVRLIDGRGASIEGDQLRWQVGVVDAGTTGAVSFWVQVVGRVAYIESSALVESAQSAPVSTNQTRTAVDVGAVIATLHAQRSVVSGTVLTYTLAYTSAGTQPTTGVAVAISIPLHTTYMDGGHYEGTLGRVRFDLGNLQPGESGAETFRVRVNYQVPDGATIQADGLIYSDQVYPAPAAGTNHNPATVQISGSDPFYPVGGSSGAHYLAQSFVAEAPLLEALSTRLYAHASPAPNLYLSLWGDVAGSPNPNRVLAADILIAGNQLHGNGSIWTLKPIFPVDVVPGQRYWLVVDGSQDRSSGGSAGGYYALGNPYPRGNWKYSVNGSTWVVWDSQTDLDLTVDYAPAPRVEPATVTVQTPVVISGPVTGLINQSYTFQAHVQSGSATPPLTYRWEADNQPAITHQDVAGFDDSVTLIWTTGGYKSLTTTVSGPDGVAISTYRIAVSVPPGDVQLRGSSSGVVGRSDTFTATVSPATAVQPLTYRWQADGQTPVEHQGGLQDSVRFTWQSPGQKGITVTVSNSAGQQIGSHHILISEPPDTHEPDDLCSQATPLAVGGVGQTHTFHKSNDIDWIYVNLDAHQTYMIEMTNVGSEVDTRLQLRRSCGGPPEDSVDDDFGATTTLHWDNRDAGRYYLSVNNADANVYGNQITEYRIRVYADREPPAAPAQLQVEAGNESLVLHWRPNSNDGTVGYRIRYGVQSGAFTQQVDIDGGRTAAFTLYPLNNGIPYYLTLLALDFSGNQSLATPEVSATPDRNADTTIPMITIQAPTAGAVYTTTRASLYISGTVMDTGHNLRYVEIHNQTNSAQRPDYSLRDAGASAIFEITDLPLEVGLNELRLTAYDDVGNSSNKNLKVYRVAGRGVAIIVAGHNDEYPNDKLQPNIYHLTDLAYRIFRNAGFREENIYYLSPDTRDADGDGVSDVNGESTPSEIKQAITQWAAARVGADTPLFLYFMDHGIQDYFCADGCMEDSVTGNLGPIHAAELGGWLTDLENQTGLKNVNIILEACYSGSFISLPGGISGPGRVIMTSASQDWLSYASDTGAHFSDVLWSQLANGQDLQTAFDQAKQAAQLSNDTQEPWLDDNGNQTANDGGDGTLAATRTLLAAFSAGVPEIQTVNAVQDGKTVQLSLQMHSGTQKMDRSWAVIYPPSWASPVVKPGDTPEDGGELVELSDPDKSDVYAGSYIWRETGAHRIVFYARQADDSLAMPQSLTVDVAMASPTLYLPVVQNKYKQETPSASQMTSIAAEFDCTTVSEIPQTDCQALADLYTSAAGSGWTHATGWLQSVTPCSWFGISCDGRRVANITLPGNGLAGTLPDSIGNLTGLTQLALDDNQMGGSLPESLGELTNLQWLYIQNNQFSGPLPTSFTNLTRLRNISAHQNQLSGPIPSGIGDFGQLTALSLHGNLFNGSIPATLGNLTALEYLYLNQNRLTGAIPVELGDLATLQVLHLGDNPLQGAIPVEIGSLSQLRQLILHNNHLSGTIPSALGQMGKLTILDLNDNQLTGSIPVSLANLTNLTALGLQNNQLTGSIPDALGELSAVQSLDLCSNRLTGAIPPALGSLFQLRALCLSGNQLSDQVPAALGNLSSLTELYLANNALAGAVSEKISALINLTQTDWRYNKLTVEESQVNLFLDGLDTGWRATQTVAPANLTADALSSNALEASWTPIAYTQDGGYYQIEVTNPQDGNDLHQGITGDKAATFFRVGGLTSGEMYIVRVRTYTPPHGEQQNGLWSAYTEPVTVTMPINPTGTPTLTPTETHAATATSTTTPTPTPSRIATATPSATATPNNPLTDIGHLALGYKHSCALDQAGQVFCWGDDEWGQLGNGQPTVDSTIPVPVSGLSSVVSVSSGTLHTCALNGNGQVFCWGWNGYGQLGTGTSDSFSPLPVPVTGIGMEITAIYAGAAHTCAQDSSHQIYCWGSNTYGQLGDGTSENRTTPVRVQGLFGAIHGISGSYHTCALTALNEVWCWGRNQYGQLGNGRTEDSSVPIRLNGSDWINVSSGNTHTCGVDNLYQAFCWGKNDFGQLGDGTTINHLTPTAIINLEKPVIKIDAGTSTTCALDNVGQLFCWGWNNFGQLGNGSLEDSLSPVSIQGITADIVGLALGRYAHACYRDLSNSIFCWGNNEFGQLGDGTLTDRATPVKVRWPEATVTPTTIHTPTSTVATTAILSPTHTPTATATPTTTTTPSPTHTPTATSTPTATPTQTPSIPSEPPTEREPNNTCVQAQPILPDGYPMEMAFQSRADDDWLKVEVQAGETYIFSAQGRHPSVHLVLEIVGDCAESGQPTFNSYSPDIRYVIDAAEDATYYLHLYNQKVNGYGAETVYSVSVGSRPAQSSGGVLVVVAGRLDDPDPQGVQSNIHTVTNQVYTLFAARYQQQGMDPDQRITYLATDVTLDANGDGVADVDGLPSLTTLSQAITEWAPQQLTPGAPFTLYLMDHGKYEQFYLDGVRNQLLTPQQLNSWLEELEQKVPGVQINVIYEGCLSGSFIAPTHSISGPGRVIITATTPHNRSFASNQGALFSDALLTALAEDSSLLQAFQEGVHAVRHIVQQQPWLDDNGDGRYQPGEDGRVAAGRSFAARTLGEDDWLWPPYIRSVDVTAADGVIVADVVDNVAVDDVWAVVYPPDYHPSTDPSQMAPAPPPVTLHRQGGESTRYSGRYGPLDQPGVYQVVVYARDKQGESGLLSRPYEVQVQAVWGSYLPVMVR